LRAKGPNLTGDSVYTADFFRAAPDRSQFSAERLVEIALDLASIRSVLDVGCATGDFVSAFQRAGVADVLGIDGDYVPRDQLLFDQALFRAIDLAGGFDLGRRFDLVLSVEVAEHLPLEAAERFVGCLAAHGPLIVFSAAIPSQGGTGHVNEQWQSWWAALFERSGYAAYDAIRPSIWHDAGIHWWYRQNAILFANAEARARHPKIARLTPTPIGALDVVHPELYLQKTGKPRSDARVAITKHSENIERFGLAAWFHLERRERKVLPQGAILAKDGGGILGMKLMRDGVQVAGCIVHLPSPRMQRDFPDHPQSARSRFQFDYDVAANGAASYRVVAVLKQAGEIEVAEISVAV
jgi:SAM-dependent methyltransferase